MTQEKFYDEFIIRLDTLINKLLAYLPDSSAVESQRSLEQEEQNLKFARLEVEKKTLETQNLELEKRIQELTNGTSTN